MTVQGEWWDKCTWRDPYRITSKRLGSYLAGTVCNDIYEAQGEERMRCAIIMLTKRHALARPVWV